MKLAFALCLLLAPSLATAGGVDFRMQVPRSNFQEHVDTFCGPTSVYHAEGVTDDSWMVSWIPDPIREFLGIPAQLQGHTRVTARSQDCAQYVHGHFGGVKASAEGRVTTGTFR